eukprot:TRINITY_DN10394_c0_g2_i1.p1 TRINITY_DN10394_c0_g2~~TRINITY_DN10394_c0_g2_i1.p1  ORF type:complete len:499 (-),score=131.85 TRINITY_DN10394_c0_g2_i1:100-1596(-)
MTEIYQHKDKDSSTSGIAEQDQNKSVESKIIKGNAKEFCFDALPSKAFRKILSYLWVTELANLRETSKRLAEIVLANDDRMQCWNVTLTKASLEEETQTLAKARLKGLPANCQLCFSVLHQQGSMPLLTAWQDWIVSLDVILEVPLPLRMPKLESLGIYRRYGIQMLNVGVVYTPNLDCSHARYLIRRHLGTLKKLMIGEDFFAPVSSDYIGVNNDGAMVPSNLEFLSLLNLPRQSAMPALQNLGRNVVALNLIIQEHPFMPFRNTGWLGDFDPVFPNLKQLRVNEQGVGIMSANADRLETLLYVSKLEERDPEEFQVMPNVKNVMVDFIIDDDDNRKDQETEEASKLLLNLLHACKSAQSLFIISGEKRCLTSAAVKMENLIELFVPSYSSWTSAMVNLNKDSIKRVIIDMKESPALLTSLQPPFATLKKILLLNCEEGRVDVEEVRQASPNLKVEVMGECYYEAIMEYFMNSHNIEKKLLFVSSPFHSKVWDQAGF